MSDDLANHAACTQCGTPAVMWLGRAEDDHALCVTCYSTLVDAQQKMFAMHATMANVAAAELEQATYGLVPVPRIKIPEQARPIHLRHFEIHNSGQIGVVNTGNVERIDVALTMLERDGSESAKRSLEALTSAVLADQSLSEETRSELLEQLAFVSMQAVEAPEKRQRAVVKSTLSTVAQLAQTSTALLTVWQAAEPVVRAVFGL